MFYDQAVLEYIAGVLDKLGRLDDIDAGGYPLWTDGSIKIMLDSHEIGTAERVEDFWVFLPKRDNNG